MNEKTHAKLLHSMETLRKQFSEILQTLQEMQHTFHEMQTALTSEPPTVPAAPSNTASTILSETDPKINALARFLNVTPSSIQRKSDTFSTRAKGDFFVFTEEELKQEAKKEMEWKLKYDSSNTLWSVRFLIDLTHEDQHTLMEHVLETSNSESEELKARFKPGYLADLIQRTCGMELFTVVGMAYEGIGKFLPDYFEPYSSQRNQLPFEGYWIYGVDYASAKDDFEWTVEEIKNGYMIVTEENGFEVIQKVDDLDGSLLQKFSNDTDAGEQALKDGMDLFTSEHPDLEDWYILEDFRENVYELEKKWKEEENCAS